MAEQLEVDSRERVAYELMEKISEHEYEHTKEKWLKPDPRAYYLRLFNQCVRASDAKATVPWIFDNEK